MWSEKQSREDEFMYSYTQAALLWVCAPRRVDTYSVKTKMEEIEEEEEEKERREKRTHKAKHFFKCSNIFLCSSRLLVMAPHIFASLFQSKSDHLPHPFPLTAVYIHSLLSNKSLRQRRRP